MKRRALLKLATIVLAQAAVGRAVAQQDGAAAPVEPGLAPPPPDPAALALRARLETPGTRIDPQAREALNAFYRERDFAPAFTRDGRWTASAQSIIARLAAASADGLDPGEYSHPSFARLAAQTASPEEAAAAEVELAGAVASYARHAMRGRVDTRRLAPNVFAEPPAVDLPAVFREIVSSYDPQAVLDGLSPRHAGFLSLKRALAETLAPPPEAAEEPRHPPIANGPIIRLGSADPRVPALRERFAIAAPPGARPEVMDAALVAAVRDFQRRQGLAANGAVGAGTVLALNGGPRPEARRDQRVATILVNMERWRWLPRDLGEKHLWVNVPEFLVKVVEDGRVIHQTRTVVGKPETPTPLFSNAVQYFVVNPSWNVPPGIAERDFIPLLNNPAALARRGIEVVRRGRTTFFRQPPGERNALGRIKFMFPNAHAIYMHDTPSRSLFQRARRVFSNGCIRVDEPLRFAEIAFSREGDVTARRIQSMVGSGERYVRLRHRLPVHLTYFTLEIDSAGQTRTLDDVYGLDRRMRGLMGLV